MNEKLHVFFSKIFYFTIELVKISTHATMNFVTKADQ